MSKELKDDLLKGKIIKAQSEPSKPIERSPSQEPAKVTIDNKSSNQKNLPTKPDMQNNNLFRLYENKGPTVNHIVKDLKKYQIANPVQFVKIKEDTEKDYVSNLIKEKVNADNSIQVRSKLRENKESNIYL